MRALSTIGPSRALGALRPLWSGCANWALGACCTCRPLRTCWAESTKTGGYVLVTACIVGERKRSNGRISAETVVVAKRYITHSRTVVAGGVGLERIITCGGVLNAGVEVKRSRPSSRIIITSRNEQKRTVTKGSVA